MKALNRFFAIALVFCVFIFVILSNLQYIAFCNDFYSNEFSKYGVSEITGMDKNQLSIVSKKIQGYLSGKLKSLQTKAIIDGKLQNVFNNKELKHMSDVKSLFAKGFILKDISIILFIFSVLFLYIKKGDVFRNLYNGMFWIIAIIILFTIVISLNFDKWFIYFHLIFFNNNLWQLDITKDKLLQMMPEGLFSDAAYLTARNSIVTFFAIGFISYFLRKK